MATAPTITDNAVLGGAGAVDLTSRIDDKVLSWFGVAEDSWLGSLAKSNNTDLAVKVYASQSGAGVDSYSSTTINNTVAPGEREQLARAAAEAAVKNGALETAAAKTVDDVVEHVAGQLSLLKKVAIGAGVVLVVVAGVVIALRVTK